MVLTRWYAAGGVVSQLDREVPIHILEQSADFSPRSALKPVRLGFTGYVDHESSYVDHER
jgi:hypothetical protein